MQAKKNKFILWFKDTTIKDIPRVGGKNASLGEMYSKLTSKGVDVPNGFSVTAAAYNYFLKTAGIKDDIERILVDLDTNSIKNLSERGAKVRATILNAKFPEDLKKAILEAYHQLSKQYKTNFTDVAIRSSATAEDLPDASFAGQQESYLHIKGDAQVLIACKKCVASLFTDRAISYRVDKKFSHFDIQLSITVQKMVRSDKACSGVMFSIDTESGFRQAVLINAAYGLGDYIVQGVVTPDEYYVFKTNLKPGLVPIISKNLGAKLKKLVYNTESSGPNIKGMATTPEERGQYVLTDQEILKLARWAVQIEAHYKKPMDMEWAKDGVTGKLFIVQARPETVRSRDNANILEEYILQGKGKLLSTGASVGAKIGKGKVHVIENVANIGQFLQGEVLVTEMTDPDWEPIMKKASAIVTNSGGRTCHAAIISRELGIPCVVGTKDGTKTIKNGISATVSCAEGEKGHVYEGLLVFKIKKTDLKKIPKPKTKIMMNIGILH